MERKTRAVRAAEGEGQGGRMDGERERERGVPAEKGKRASEPPQVAAN